LVPACAQPALKPRGIHAALQYFQVKSGDFPAQHRAMPGAAEIDAGVRFHQ
jgi:hypothetical protein